jgi:hypothetical protein
LLQFRIPCFSIHQFPKVPPLRSVCFPNVNGCSRQSVFHSMNLSLPWHWSWRKAVGPLALLIAWIFAPTICRAECGDYVILGHGAASMASNAEKKAIPSTAAADQHLPNAPIPPCSGPSCSRNHPAAPLVPPPPAPESGKQWGCTSETPGNPELESGFYLMDGFSLQPCRIGNSVFHPPRSTAFSS